MRFCNIELRPGHALKSVSWHVAASCGSLSGGRLWPGVQRPPQFCDHAPRGITGSPRGCRFFMKDLGIHDHIGSGSWNLSFKVRDGPYGGACPRLAPWLPFV